MITAKECNEISANVWETLVGEDYKKELARVSEHIKSAAERGGNYCYLEIEGRFKGKIKNALSMHGYTILHGGFIGRDVFCITVSW